MIVDPCLTGVGAHPLENAASLLDAALARGWRGTLLCRTGCRIPSRGPRGWETLPRLRFPGASKLTAFAELDRCDARGRPRFRAPWSEWRSRARRAERVAAFAADLRPVVDGLRPGDHLFIATASELDALGLATCIAAARPPAGIGWHLQFHGPLLAGPLGTAPAGSRADAPPDGPPLAMPHGDARLERVRRMLDEAIALASPHPLRFRCPTAELAAEWAWAGAAGATELPYPIDVPTMACTGDGGPLRVALLGDARAEKNSQHVAALVEAVAADRVLRDSLRFTLQTNPGFAATSRRADDRAVLRSIAAVAARGDRLVECVAGPLARAEYLDRLAGTDAVLLAYDQTRYRQRCSAVLLETQAAGRVPIVIGGGWMARQLRPAIHAWCETLADREAGASWRHPALSIAAGETTTIPLAGPDDAAAVVVEARWKATGRDALFAPPIRVELHAGAAGAAATLEPSTAGGTSAILPLTRGTQGAAPRLRIAAAMVGPGVELAGLGVRWLRGLPSVPRSAAGIVVADAGQVVDGLEEFVAHASHYTATAAARAEAVRRRHAPAAVLEALIA